MLGGKWLVTLVRTQSGHWALNYYNSWLIWLQASYLYSAPQCFSLDSHDTSLRECSNSVTFSSSTSRKSPDPCLPAFCEEFPASVQAWAERWWYEVMVIVFDVYYWQEMLWMSPRTCWYNGPVNQIFIFLFNGNCQHSPPPFISSPRPGWDGGTPVVTYKYNINIRETLYK